MLTVERVQEEVAAYRALAFSRVDPWGISYNLVPFAGIARTVADAAQTGWWWSIAALIVGGNVLMFVPLGIMLSLLSERLRRLLAAALVLAACSVAIESVERFEVLRNGVLLDSGALGDLLGGGVRRCSSPARAALVAGAS